MDELLHSMSSAELGEWMAEFQLRAEAQPSGNGHGSLQHASGQDAIDVLAKHVKRGG